MLLKMENAFSVEKSTTNRKIIITTSWDDGHPLDLRLAELLKRYGIPATFYIPVRNSEREHMTSKQISEISKNFDIGGHTLNHFNLKKLSQEEVEKEIIYGKKRMEEIISKPLRCFCYPQGAYNKEIIKIVKKAGFSGARTVKLFRTKIKNVYELGTTVHACGRSLKRYFQQILFSKNIALFSFLLKQGVLNKEWDQIALTTLDYILKNGGIWHLWGHSWEIEEHNDWGRLEKVFKHVNKTTQDLNNITFADNSKLIKLIQQ